VDEVLRLGGIADDAEGGGVQGARKAVVERGEGGAVAGGHAGDEAGVVALAVVGLRVRRGVAHRAAPGRGRVVRTARHRDRERERGVWEREEHLPVIRTAWETGCKGCGGRVEGGTRRPSQHREADRAEDDEEGDHGEEAHLEFRDGEGHGKKVAGSA
jgi:hypothetical protein